MTGVIVVPRTRTKIRRWVGRDCDRLLFWYGCRRLLLRRVADMGMSLLAIIPPDEVAAGHTGWKRTGEVDKVKKRNVQKAASDAAHIAPVESTVLSRHHSLVRHCCEVRYDDGDARQPGWFSVKTMGSAWVVEVKDPDTCSRLVVIQATLDDALTLAALLLDADEAPWEADPWLTAAKAKKKK